MKSRIALLSAIAAAGIAGAVGMAAPAWAAPTTEIIQGKVLRLVSVADWSAAGSLLPGERVRWDVTVSADAPDPGTVTLAVSATGTAPLLIDAALCMQAWQEAGCPGGAEQIETEWSLPRDGSPITLAEFPTNDVGHLRLWITLAATGDVGAADAVGITDMRVHARGVGETVITGPDGPLPATGGTVAPAVLGAGVAMVAVGLGLVVVRRARAGERAVQARGENS